MTTSASSFWPPTIVAVVAALLRDGRSASQIAADLRSQHGLNITRNAVIGRVHRNAELKAIGFSNTPQHGSRFVTKRTGARTLPKPRTARLAKARPPAREAHQMAATRLAVLSPPAALNLPIEDLTAAQCRWPVEQDAAGRYLFCAAPIEDYDTGRRGVGHSWCLHHRRQGLARKED